LLNVQNYNDLKVWAAAMDFTKQVYEATSFFPKSELYGLTSQLRRAAVSIACNIAEGCGRRSQSELRQFVHIALGSAQECETLILLAYRLGFVQQEAQDALASSIRSVSRMLHGLLRAIDVRIRQSEH